MDIRDSALAHIAKLKQDVIGGRDTVKSARETLSKIENELAEATAVLYLVEIVHPTEHEQRQTAKIIAISEHVQRRIGMFTIKLDEPRRIAVYLKYTDDLLGRQFRIFWPVGQELNFTEHDDDEDQSEGRDHRACLFLTLEEAQAFRDRVLGHR